MKKKSHYLQIDKLRDKFDAGKPLTLREVCFILWAELNVCSDQYLMFAYWIKQNKLDKHKFKWQIWEALFDSFAKNDYPVLSKDFDLVRKILKMGTRIMTGKKHVI
jgi:hypothetical protein